MHGRVAWLDPAWESKEFVSTFLDCELVLRNDGLSAIDNSILEPGAVVRFWNAEIVNSLTLTHLVGSIYCLTCMPQTRALRSTSGSGIAAERAEEDRAMMVTNDTRVTVNCMVALVRRKMTLLGEFDRKVLRLATKV